MEKIDIGKYDYIMFVDASGDDGFKFDKGSSLCYAVSCFLVKKPDLEHNINILNKIKHLMNYDINNPNHELKYTSLRRHPKSKESHEYLKELKGSLFSTIAFKEFLIGDPNFEADDKFFSSACHTLSIQSIKNYCSENDINNVLIVIDRMKKLEMDNVAFLSEFNLKKIDNIKNFDIIFKDSKDKDFQLIQIADVLSGINRNFFELYKTCSGFIEFWKKCPLCLWSKKNNLVACRNNKNQIEPKKHYNFNCIKALHYHQDLTMKNLIILPPNKAAHLHFIRCKKRQKK